MLVAASRRSAKTMSAVAREVHRAAKGWELGDGTHTYTRTITLIFQRARVLMRSHTLLAFARKLIAARRGGVVGGCVRAATCLLL